jgi:N-acetylmuramoyl-L-alanine amidase
LLVSCHSNAVGNNIRGPSLPAQGIEVYTSRGTTRSDAVAESLAESFRVNLASLRWRRVAEANFFILRRSTMPAVLGEVGFFTNIGDASFLLEPSNHAKISAAYWKGVSSWFS